MQSINVSGTGNSVAVAADHSSATVLSVANTNSELERLIQEVQKQASIGLSEEDKQKVDEGISFVEAEVKTNTPRMTIIKGILEGLKAINGTVQFASAVTALIKFFE